MDRLVGKVALITGGASGIGLATTERFVDEGAKVVFVDLSADGFDHLVDRLGEETARVHYSRREKHGPNDGFAIARRLGPNALFVPADVTVADDLAGAVDTAVREFGALDVLFNNAGVAVAEGNIVDCPERVFDRIVDVDLKAVWRGIKLAAPYMIAQGSGSIISTSSGTGLAGVPGVGAYSAAKGGVIALTRVAAMELASASVRVNCICPGMIITPLLEASLDPAVLQGVRTTAHPIPRAGEATDIADIALWLASDESTFVTGQAIAVDGGLTAELDARMRNQS